MQINCRCFAKKFYKLKKIPKKRLTNESLCGIIQSQQKTTRWFAHGFATGYFLKNNFLEERKTMKKILSLVLAILMIAGMLAAFSSCGGKKGTLYVYTNAGFAPFEYVNEKGKVVGVDIDVMKAIGKELGYKVVINDIEFDNILTEVQGNEFAVGAAGMSKKEERDEVALASNVYATSQQYVIAPVGTFADGAVVTVDQIVALEKKVGVQKGTTGADLIQGENADKTIEYTNAIVASQDIGSTLSAVVIDELPAKQIAGDKDTLACWKIDAEMESYVLYFNKNATALVEEVNKVLDKLIADKTIDQYIINHSSGK